MLTSGLEKLQAKRPRDISKTALQMNEMRREMFAYLELNVEIVRPEQMHHSGHPSLLLRHLLRIVRLSLLVSPPPPSTIYTSIPSTARSIPHRRPSINALVPDQHATHSQHPTNIPRTLNHRLVLQNRANDRMRDRPSRVVRLRLEQGNVARDGEKGEDGEVGVDRGEQEGEQVGRSGWGVEIRGGRELGDLGSGEGEDLVDVFELIRVAGEGEVDQGDEESGDVLEGEVRSGLGKREQTSSAQGRITGGEGKINAP
jgi:hypothetical protein